MARRLLINEHELDALDGLPHLAVTLYLKAIRPYMDYATGITGWKRGISYQSIAEQLYVEPEPGRHKSLTGAPTKAAVRHAIKSLINQGLLKVLPAGKKLVLECLLAESDKSVSTRNNTGATQTNDTAATQALAALQQELEQIREAMNNTPQPDRSDTPPVSGNYLSSTTTSAEHLDQDREIEPQPPQAGGGAGSDMKLIFPKQLGEKQQNAIRQSIPTDDQEQAQALVDELAGLMQTQDIKNPASYFGGICRRFKAGDFVPTAGPAIAEARERNRLEAEQAKQRHKEMTRPKEERTNNEATAAGRAAMKAALKGAKLNEHDNRADTTTNSEH